MDVHTHTRVARTMVSLSSAAAVVLLAACDSDRVTNTGQTNIGEQVSNGIVPIQTSPLDSAHPPFTLTPQMQAVVDQMNATHPLPISTLSPNEARNQPTARDAVLAAEGHAAVVEPVGNVAQRMIAGPGGPLLVRVYTPAGTGPFPVLVYFHGGGWVIANLDTYDASARALTNAARAVVLSVAYRQAPEHKFPAAANDAFAAYQWALDSASAVQGDSTKVAVGGESAGGNLATVVTLMARDRGVKPPVHQLLIYPLVDVNFETQSYHENANAPFLTRTAAQWFLDKYLNSASDVSNPYAAPIRASSFTGLPSATIITAQVDPLRSDGENYATKLQSAGVSVAYRSYTGVTHEFFGMGAVVSQAIAAVQFAGQHLQTAFAAAGH